MLTENSYLPSGENPATFPSIIELNVGGCYYCTSIQTLQRFPDSMLGTMFSGRFPLRQDKQGRYFIDRDGNIFRYVLNYLRNSKLTLPDDFTEYDLLIQDLDFYQIKPLIREATSLRQAYLQRKHKQALPCTYQFVELIWETEGFQKKMLCGNIDVLKRIVEDAIPKKNIIYRAQVNKKVAFRLCSEFDRDAVFSLLGRHGFKISGVVTGSRDHNQSKSTERWLFFRNIQY